MPLRLGRLPPPAHRHPRAPRRLQRHRARRLQNRLHRQAHPLRPRPQRLRFPPRRPQRLVLPRPPRHLRRHRHRRPLELGPRRRRQVLPRRKNHSRQRPGLLPPTPFKPGHRRQRKATTNPSPSPSSSESEVTPASPSTTTTASATPAWSATTPNPTSSTKSPNPSHPPPSSPNPNPAPGINPPLATNARRSGSKARNLSIAFAVVCSSSISPQPGCPTSRF